ncbi:MAG: ABC transporter substrate-binding protein [Chloroflexota bacterium]|nr:ABC transporter substrate-binding protein [Chloroflexota bacterium]
MSRIGMSARSRRTALRILAGTPALLALAACGESQEDRTTPPPSTGRSDLNAALQRARTAAASVTKRAPEPGASLPQPGEGREVPIAVMSLDVAGPRLFGLFANGLREAGRQSEGRYKFDDVPLDFIAALNWSMSRALAAVEASAPELVVFFGTDLDDLVAHDQLTPLDDYLAADPDFDAGAFWPGVLERGRHNGVQFGLPFAVSPEVTLVNGELADVRDIKLPEPTLQAFTGEAYLNTAQAFHEPEPPDGGTGTQGILGVLFSEPTPEGDYIVNPPLGIALNSALGSFRDSAGGLTPLESDKAREVLDFYRDLVHRHQLIPIGSLDYGRYIQAGRWGMGFASIAFSDAGQFIANTRVYPFPAFGSGRNPSSTFLLGVVNSGRDPSVSYDALRHLHAVIALESTLPPFRVDASVVRQLMPELNGEDEHVIVHLLENATYPDLSRSEYEVLSNTLVRDVLLGDTDPAEGLRRAVQEMQELQAGG